MRFFFLLSISAFLFLTHLHDNAFANEPVVYPAKNWVEKSPESQGIDPVKLQEAMDYLKANCDSEYGIKSVAIICNGYLIYKGESSKAQRSVFSVTKSFTSTIAGHLIDQGKLKLETHAKDIEPLLAEKYPDVTIRHFLTMTSGYSAVGDSPWPNFKIDDCSLTPFDPDKPLFAPGTKYCYYDEAMMMFGRVLTRVCGQSLTDYLQSKILTPMGIDSSWSWNEKRGVLNQIPIDNGSCYISMSAEQLARFGYLFLNNGKWGEKQLVSNEWVEQATRNQVPATIPLMETKRIIDGRGEYGFNWWINGFSKDGQKSLPNAPDRTYYASGANNNQCFVVPEWKMVIVRLGDYDSKQEPSWDNFFELLAKARIENK